MARPLELIDASRMHREEAEVALAGKLLAEGDQAQPAIEGPIAPNTIEATGLHIKFLTGQLLRIIHVLGLELGPDLAAYMKLSQPVMDKLLTTLKQQGLLEIHGSVGATVPLLRYALTSAGRELALDSFKTCQFVGPAPVTLDDYRAQVARQSILKERVAGEALAKGLSHLVLSKELVRRLGPAINSGRSLLFYGPPGNGKTSISEAAGRVFKQTIYIPYCLEVDGQIIKIFDPTVHTTAAEDQEIPGGGEEITVLKCKDDPRWVKCRRPVIAVGGELTLEMLDLDFDPISKYYEAPVHVKATGGVFIIDDFGRQLVQPKALLNRWIVPLEKRIDFMTVHTGKKFDMPFDELVIFSTNIPPNELMDAAQLRRVKYKVRIDPPQVSDYIKIFRQVCEQHQLDLPESILNYLLNDFYPRTGSGGAAFHPIFIVEHVIATCRYEGIRPRLSLELVRDALANIYIHESDRDLGRNSPGGV